MGYSWISQFAGRNLVLDIHNLLIYYVCPPVPATGKGERDFDVWRVTAWYGGCLWCTMVWRMLVVKMQWCLGCTKILGLIHFFWIPLNQNIGHIFCTRFCVAVNDNQVIWPAHSFFKQTFYWPFIIIYLTLLYEIKIY